MKLSTAKFDFSGRLALVIGGSSGIGEGVVKALSECGAKVLFASRGSGNLDSDATFIPCDIQKDVDVSAMFKKVDSYGNLDFLVNAAAISSNTKISEIDQSQWDIVMDTNLRSIFFACKYAIERMRRQNFGRIVSISSIAGRHRSLVAGVHYTASKAGIIGLSRQLAFEQSGKNININVVCPSQTLTPLLEKAMSDVELKNLSSSIPLGRIAEVEEQVTPILFLLSDAASYINGAVIDINGGQL